jgi:hypothetical protein
LAASETNLIRTVNAAITSRTNARRVLAQDVLFAFGLFAAALLIAMLIDVIVRGRLEQPERAVEIVGLVLSVLMMLPVGVYVIFRRGAARLDNLALVLLGSFSLILVALYLYSISFRVNFPADILIWSESDFVNDILKFRLGYPLYTAEVNNESFVYMPGTQLLTYALAWLAGSPLSIPVYRMIQVAFTLLAAILATLCVRVLINGVKPTRALAWQWTLLWFPFLFLVATNPLTNPFVYALHDDALALLVNVIAYCLLLLHVLTRDRRVLVAMAFVPAVGFFVKQNLVIWAVLYCIQLALFERPFSFKRLGLFGCAAFGGVVLVAAACYWVWGQPFVYWIFTVLGSHGVSALRSFEHLLDVWMYVAMGLVGGFILLRGPHWKLFLGPWVIWLLLMASEIYTSGIAWMINHIGPGCLIAAVWFAASITRVSALFLRGTLRTLRSPATLRTTMALGVFALLFGGLQVIRIPLPTIPTDAYRYLAEIEAQYAGVPTKDVLMDAGTWVYVPEGVIQQDRAPAIGERGYSETGDFSGILQRLREKKYAKILVRNYDSPDFWYDHYLWAKSSGIRQALLENYHVAGKIPAVQTNGYEPDLGYLFQEITILVPNPH